MTDSYVVYTVTVDATTYHGIATDPTAEWDAFVKDSQARESETVLGEKLRNASTPGVFTKLSKPMEYARAQEMIEMLENVKRLDVQTKFPRNKRTMYFCTWATQDATNELHRLFFWLESPLHALEGDTLEDIVDTFFYVLCAQPRNYVSHGCVYDKRTHKCVIKAEPPKLSTEVTPTDFGAMTAPWLVKTIEQLCQKIVAGCRNDINTHFVLDDVRPRAIEILDMIHAMPPKMLKKKRNPIAVRLFKTLEDVAKDPINLNSTFEKLVRLYPKGHPNAPEFHHYKKRIQATTMHGADVVSGTQSVLDKALLDKVTRKKQPQRET